jgi:hypothetical protein
MSVRVSAPNVSFRLVEYALPRKFEAIEVARVAATGAVASALTRPDEAALPIQL